MRWGDGTHQQLNTDKVLSLLADEQLHTDKDEEDYWKTSDEEEDSFNPFRSKSGDKTHIHTHVHACAHMHTHAHTRTHTHVHTSQLNTQHTTHTAFHTLTHSKTSDEAEEADR